MAETSTAGPSTLLTIPLEIRQTIYHHLFATEADRELRLCSNCWSPWLADAAPVQVLRTCHQVHDEAIEVFVERLGNIKLVVGGCKTRDCSRDHQIPLEDSILSTYGNLVTKVHLLDEATEWISLEDILYCCPRVQKLVVDTRPTGIEIYAGGDETEDWWLNSTWVEEWLWDLWKERVPVTWCGCYSSELVNILEGQKGEGQNYELNIIADFWIREGFDNWLEVVFNGDTGASVRRDLSRPFEASRIVNHDE